MGLVCRLFGLVLFGFEFGLLLLFMIGVVFLFDLFMFVVAANVG